MAATISVQQYEQAERDVMRAEGLQGFRIHAMVYTAVNILLIAINLYLITQTNEDFVWFVFPLVCWGVGLTMHWYFGVRRVETSIAAWQHRIEERAQAS
jgi:hypothetical protein